MTANHTCRQVSFPGNFLSLQSCIESIHTGSHVDLPTRSAKRLVKVDEGWQMPSKVGTGADLGWHAC